MDQVNLHPETSVTIGENSGFLDNDYESSQLTPQDKRNNPLFRKLRPPTEIKRLFLMPQLFKTNNEL